MAKNDEPVFLDTTYVYKGYCERIDSASDATKYQRLQLVPASEQVKFFEKTLKYFQQQNIKVLLVQHPIPSKEIVRSSHDRFASTISLIAAKYNVSFYDFAEEPGFDAYYHFYDNNHLNAAGVKLFNQRLIERINRDKIF
jgi:lysophospholipase L1-like esterase